VFPNLHNFRDVDEAVSLLYETFGGLEAQSLAQTAHDLILHVWKVAYQLCQSELRSVYPQDYQVRCFNEAQDDWTSAWGLMQWIADTSQNATELRNRVERGFSTILLAGNAVNQSSGSDGSRWFSLGFEKQPYPYGSWWGAILIYYPAVLTAPDSPLRKVAVVASGDHCQDCSAKAREIVEWVRTALSVLPTYVNSERGDKGLVAFAFTRPGAHGVDAVIAALQAEFGNSAIPIIISWIADGQIKYQCIGTQAACAAARHDGSARRAACLQQNQCDA
jgi:hypothetical protein